MKTLYTCALGAMSLLAASCSGDSSKWHINGTVNGMQEGEKLVLEGNNQGYWYVIDSITPAKDGKIKYAGEIHGYPDIFRLRLGNSTIYFPIDSIETVTIEASAPDIASTHTLGGSPQAENLARVDSLINAVAAVKGPRGAAADEALKKKLGQMVVADPSGVVSYYIISKRIGDVPLFDPSASVDHRIIGAVANSFNAIRPEDPRTKYLKRLYLSNRRFTPSVNNDNGTLQANVIRAFEIDLYDNAGKRQSLLDITSKGQPVILSFTAYGAEWSPVFNVELNKVYEKYHNQGLEIYQVSMDTDEYNWKLVAKNLPWITVLNNLSDGAKVLRQYNVSSLPTTFVFNRNGELVERVLDIADLDKAVAKTL